MSIISMSLFIGLTLRSSLLRLEVKERAKSDFQSFDVFHLFSILKLDENVTNFRTKLE